MSVINIGMKIYFIISNYEFQIKITYLSSIFLHSVVICSIIILNFEKYLNFKYKYNHDSI